MSTSFANHPCFNAEARHRFGRVHLPVAPDCNVQCNFCDRKTDCINESRPGVTSVVLSPGQAVTYLRGLLERRPEISVVGSAGPGDPFADAELTMETLRRVHAEFPDKLLCVATNGLGIGPHVAELAHLGVSHVTVTINAVDPEIGAKVYAWVRDGRRVLRGVEGARLILERQTAAVKALAEAGITVKINSIIIPGLNDQHIEAVANFVRSLGAGIMNCIPLIPAPGSAFAEVPAPDGKLIEQVRKVAGEVLPQMSHCSRCRADACGLLNEGTEPVAITALQDAARLPLNPEELRPYVAVASREGLLVNQHLGEATQVLIYGMHEGNPGLLDERLTPEPGSGLARWSALADLLKDCHSVLVSGVGPSPRRILERSGLKVIQTEGLIEESLSFALHNKAIPASLQKRFAGCGKECKGSGQGCG